MRTGYPWLIAASLLLAIGPRPAAAQQPSPDSGPARLGSSTTTRPNAQNSYMPPAPIRAGQPISVMVFPFGYSAETPAAAPAPGAAGTAPPDTGTPPAGTGVAGTAVGTELAPGLSPAQQELANYLTAAVKAGLLSTPAFLVTSYSKQSALVQRARAQDILREDQLTDLVAPASGAVSVDKAKVVAHRLGIQTILVGTIDRKDDAKANSSEVTLETQLINSTTGEVLNTAAVSGSAAGAEGVPMDSVEERAAEDAAQKILPAMGIELVPVAAPEAAPAKGGKRLKSAPARHNKEQQKAAAAQKREQERLRAEQKAQERAAKKSASARTRPVKGAPAEASAPEPEAPGTGTAMPDNSTQPAPALQPAPAAEPPPAAPPAPAVQPVRPAPAAGPGAANPTPYRGSSDASGQPIPYGYALGNVKTALPPRNRGGLKVPSWLGVAGFLAGVSFLL